MKNIKIILIVAVIILLTGCSNKSLIKVYDNMKASEDMNGYSIDLRIYGKVEGTSYNTIIKISNYKDEKFLVTEINSNTSKAPNKTNETENLTYIIDGKIYRKVDEEYKEVEEYNYTNPLIYLEGLNNIKKIIDNKEEKVGETTYDVYTVNIKKSFLNTILKEVGIEDDIKNDCAATIYVNNDEYLYRIIYKIKELTINVNYYKINKSLDITLPN